jgi:hypothetical protein
MEEQRELNIAVNNDDDFYSSDDSEESSKESEPQLEEFFNKIS